MSKCAWCSARKGKRVCPAIGSICAPCCGQHRLREIPCPETCFYLRRAGKEVTGSLQTVYSKLFNSFLEGQRSSRQHDAVGAWVDEGREIEDWERASFIAYLLHGHVDASGQRYLDLYLREHEGHLSTSERSVLTMLSNAHVSLFEIVEIESDKGLWLEDRITGEAVFVRERLGARQENEGALLLAWVGTVPDGHVLTGAITEIPPAHAGAVLDLIDRELRRTPDGAESPDSAHATVQRTLPQIHRLLRAAVSNWKMPKLLAPDGEEVQHCHATYELSDPREARKRLAAHPQIEPLAEGRFAWYDETEPGSAAALFPPDSVEIRTVRLTLTTLTRKRLHERKRELEHYLGKLAAHRSDRIDDLSPGVASEGSVPLPARESRRPRTLGADTQTIEETPSAEGSAKEEAKEEGGADAAPVVAPASDGHRLPRTAHEAMSALIPGLRPTINEAVRMLRRGLGDDEPGVIAHEALASLEPVERFVHAHARSMVEEGCSSQAAIAEADMLGMHIHYMVNLELHRRKLFWVDESLAWMLSQTRLDIQGEHVRLPFPACAYIFADPGTLELAESLLSQDETCGIRGERLEVLTVYVLEDAHQSGGRGIHLYFLFGSRKAAAWPYMLTRDLLVQPDDHLEAILDSHFPDVLTESLDPIFLAPELKALAHLVINAILYATSAHLDPIILEPARGRRGKGARKKGRSENHADATVLRLGRSSEAVYYLPGTIDISRIRSLRDIENSHEGRKIMTRFMVRGHWRRALPSWKDQRLRWIEPYWKGPEMATIIEREYRLKP